jgi:hypothetical protein
MFIAFSLIIGGTTKKVLQFKMPLKFIYNINLSCFDQKHIFEHYGEIETRRNLLIDFIFVTKKSDDFL